MIAILAGGKGKRYGKDKLNELIDGRRVIERLLSEFPQATLITTSEERCKLYSAIRCVIDNGEGPAEAMRSLSGTVTFIPGDMPFVTKEMVEKLVSYKNVFKADVAVPIHADGFMESLFISVNLDALDLEKVKRKLGRPLRATDFIRFANRRIFVGSKLISRFPVNFAHLNTPLDLRIRYSKSPLGEELLVLNSPFEPCESIEEELKTYRKLGLVQLETHARRDLEVCNQIYTSSTTQARRLD
ncbi:hypothetical protein EYM_01950 [Ignicoccus islandicus DSM 13165]|uniref:MobA-like NTP transferase domain-containing protein n=1 Tax=Ignicoccus islandicus DSM 13165 TaxID=940295 RepID=A0A0U3G1Q6_9CREN|nr:NTP transferase domain-containing protein [Ignicoccus islandicus]ALU12268.1 hypothetical protein EYM_01950 [Ignicoccus islandicus DSM 13165]